jgi:VWFA-related protein
MLLFVLPQIATAQVEKHGPTPSPPVFQSNSRLVVVDVVVLGSHNDPVPQLKAEDFKVLEDGKPQRLTSFEENRSTRTTERPKPFHLPPHQYTNVPEEEPKGALTVILFDTLNTPAIDQDSARLQMLKFLKTLPAGERTALFTLGTKLRLIQTFTGDSQVLASAASKLLSSPSPLLLTEAEHQRQEDDAIYRERMMGPAINSGAQNLQSVSVDAVPIATQNLRDALSEQEQSTIEQRIGMTLESLTELAEMLPGYAGRKNLIWLSGGFPFSIGPDPLLHSDHPDVEHFDAAIRQTSNLLSAAQVAVYPIDVGGVRNQGIDLASSGEGSSGVDASTGLPRMNSTLMRQLTASTDEHAVMDQIAEETGGKAFYGTNDVQTAMQRSVEEGSTYYTLSYSPQNQNWNGKFRRIDVKLERTGYHLQYRRGYFALQEPEHSNSDSTIKLVSALRPGMPDSTSLYLKAKILPPDAEHRDIRITCLIHPLQITFSDTNHGAKHAVLDILTVAWDKNGKDVGHSALTVETNLDAAQYQKVLRSGLQVEQAVPLSGDAYRVRFGAVDRASQRVGTIDVVFQAN